MKKTNLIFLISTAIFFTSTLVLIYLNYLKPQSSSIPATVDTPTETSDPTADWKTYENEEYGIEFKYPSDYELTENYVTPDRNLYYVSIIKLTEPAERKGYSLTNTELKMEIYVSKDDTKKVLSGEQLKINNHDFWYTKSSSPGGGESYSTIEKNIFYEIAKYPVETTLQNEFAQILSTFKFTDTQSSVGNWIKRQNGDFETNDNCLWVDTSKANDNGSLDSYIERIFPGTTIDKLLYKTQYKVNNSQTITISPQGVGELFTVYFPKDDKKYSITFHSASQDNVLGQDNCSNYQKEIDFVLNNPELFI